MPPTKCQCLQAFSGSIFYFLEKCVKQEEIIYQRAFSYELTQKRLDFVQELKMNIFYKNLVNPIGSRRVDFLVEEKVLLELKAVILLDDVHLAQALNYLEAFKLEVGLLINFGSKKLPFRRLMKNKEQLKL